MDVFQFSAPHATVYIFLLQQNVAAGTFTAKFIFVVQKASVFLEFHNDTAKETISLSSSINK